MKNRDFYKEQISDIICSGNTIAVDKETNGPCQCEGMACSDCAIKADECGGCRRRFVEWCNAEYVETCPFEKDELVEVSGDGKDWALRYFSHVENGMYYAFFNGCKSNEPQHTVMWEFCRKYGTLGGLVNGE